MFNCTHGTTTNVLPTLSSENKYSGYDGLLENIHTTGSRNCQVLYADGSSCLLLYSFTLPSQHSNPSKDSSMDGNT
jgi:hypothetical protein